MALTTFTVDSYDNALAESVIGLYKTEVIVRRGPWRHAEQVELATLTWIDWWNHRRLVEPLGHVPPAEHEAAYYRGTEPRPRWSDSTNRGSGKPGAVQGLVSRPSWDCTRR